MRKIITLSLVIAVIVAITNSLKFIKQKPLSEKDKYSEYLQNHPYNNRPRKEHDLFESEEEEEQQADQPNLAWEQDYLRTMNPALGRPTQENLVSIMSAVKRQNLYKGTPGSGSAPWIERGPNNVGGRTLSLTWDPNDGSQKKVWAGSATGGLWYNNDITNSFSSWNAVDDFWSNLSVTCMAFDPTNSQVAYVGTGEGFGAHASLGAGIWKTTDGGTTWAQIASTTSYYYINDIVVRNESGTGVIYAAVDGVSYQGTWHGDSNFGLRRSTNGGTTWTQVMPTILGQSNNYSVADIEISASNRIWVGSKANPFGSGGGTILYSDNGTSFTVSNTTTVTSNRGRVELACAPSNANVVYAMIENGGAVSAIKKTTTAGTSWSNVNLPMDADTGIPGTDFSRGQAWYDLIMTVDPNKENIFIVGGIDLFRTTTAGNTWTQISKWSENNNLANLPCSYVHADQHSMAYKPGSSSTIIFGCDGGVFYSSNIDSANLQDVISKRNVNYSVTQFYACAQAPDAGSNNFLAGAQDNGTQKFVSAGVGATTEATGGDGAFCFIDQTNPSYQITSYVYNNYYLSSDGGNTFTTKLINDGATGSFINVADYDNNLHNLYTYKGSGTLYRVSNVTTNPSAANTLNISGFTGEATAITVSPFTTSSASTLFIGTSSGKLLKVPNAHASASLTAVEIGGAIIPVGSISCIEFGSNENEILVTYFNYGITSLWYTTDGGTTWASKEGNLPDMPIRWALINPNNKKEVIGQPN